MRPIRGGEIKGGRHSIKVALALFDPAAPYKNHMGFFLTERNSDVAD